MFLSTVALTLVLGGAPDAGSLPAFALENFDGRPFTTDSLAGKTTIVVPTYAKCVFACPMITFFLTELDASLGAPANIQYVHVSVQPTEDTAEEILDHFDEHGIDTEADPRWLFVNGPVKEIQKFLADTGIDVTRTRLDEGILVEHTIRVFVVGPRGETLAELDTYFWDEKEMRHALRYAIE